MNAFLAVTLFMLAVVAVFFVVSLLLWWLVPLAFPALAFGFWNAVALSALLWLFSAPAIISN